MERRNLSNLRLSELFNIAKSLDIKYIRKYNKADLIKAIIKAEEQLHKEIKNGKKINYASFTEFGQSPHERSEFRNIFI
jgi:transcription termination factor Rho